MELLGDVVISSLLVPEVLNLLPEFSIRGQQLVKLYGDLWGGLCFKTGLIPGAGDKLPEGTHPTSSPQNRGFECWVRGLSWLPTGSVAFGKLLFLDFKFLSYFYT